jgi:hypothetical protein
MSKGRYEKASEKKWRSAPGSGGTIVELDATREAAELDGMPVDRDTQRAHTGGFKMTSMAWNGEMRLPEQEVGGYKFRGLSTWMERE